MNGLVRLVVGSRLFCAQKTFTQELEEERKARQEVLSVFNRSRSDFADAAEYERYADHIEDLGLYAHTHTRETMQTSTAQRCFW